MTRNFERGSREGRWKIVFFYFNYFILRILNWETGKWAMERIGRVGDEEDPEWHARRMAAGMLRDPRRGVALRGATVPPYAAATGRNERSG